MLRRKPNATKHKHSTELVGHEVLHPKKFSHTIRALENKKNHFPRKRILIPIIITIFLVCLGAYGYFNVKPRLEYIYNSALSGKENLEKAQVNLLEKNDFKEATADLNRTEVNFREAKDKLQEFSYVTDWPYLGKQYQAINGLLTTTLDAIESLKKVVNFCENVFGPIFSDPARQFNDIGQNEKSDILKSLKEAVPVLDAVRLELEQIEKNLNEIPSTGLLPQIEDVARAAKDNLPRLHRLVQNAEVMAKVGPTLAGYQNTNHLLILFQNNWELRPTGGFIGSLATADLKDGELSNFHGSDVYTVDIPAADQRTIREMAPEPLQKYLGLQYWYLRDSNISPDFAESARKAIYFYQKETRNKQTINTVVALNPEVIKEFLNKTGSIKIDGYPYTFTGDNFTETLQHHVEQGYLEMGIPETKRKDIMIHFQAKLLSRFFDLPKEDLIELARITIRALNNKDLIIYSDNAEAQSVLEAENWAGRIRETTGDYLALIDANMASLKTDKCIKRDLSYEIRMISKDEAAAKVTVNYEHTCDNSFLVTQYKDYVRLYVPKGSSLIKVSGLSQNNEVKTNEELGKTNFAGLLIIDPLKKVTINYEYKLPTNIVNDILNGGYRLLVQKQSGTYNPSLVVLLKFNDVIKSANGPSEGIFLDKNKTIKFETNLEKDREFNVVVNNKH